MAERYGAQIRESDGSLPKFAWPGGYPIFYYVADDGAICPDCANGKNGSRAADPGLDPECPDDDQWRIVTHDINYEDPELYCEHCNARIPSAYAEKD